MKVGVEPASTVCRRVCREGSMCCLAAGFLDFSCSEGAAACRVERHSQVPEPHAVIALMTHQLQGRRPFSSAPMAGSVRLHMQILGVPVGRRSSDCGLD